MYIHIKVSTDSKKEKIEALTDNKMILYIREPAENNRANERVLEIVRDLYPNRAIRMIKGHHSPSKIIEIDR